MSVKIPENTTDRQYYDENNVYHNETMVYFSQCNPNGNISLNEILKLTSDVAVEAFKRLYYSREEMAEKGVAILVSRESFRIHKFPKENQQIVVDTWEEKNEPLQFVRAFELRSRNGEKLITARSAWLLVDLKARRILPVKKFCEMLPDYVPTDRQSEQDCLNYGKISIPEDVQLWDERIIKYSDLDANGHTNNSRYGAFAADALPVGFRDREFKDFRINFAKEAMLGQKVSVYGKVVEAEKTVYVTGRTEEGTSFEIELRW